MGDRLNAFEVGSDERVLFVLTHPDDEIAVAAFIWRLSRTNISVRVIWTHSTSIRKTESLEAMSLIGVERELLTFLEGTDGGTLNEIPRLREEITKVVEEFRPTRIVTHAFEQGHLDHDTTNLLVHLSYNGPTFEAPFYHTYLTRFPAIYKFSKPDDEQAFKLSADEIAKKREMLECYPSQTIKRNIVLYDLARKLGLRKHDLLTYERLRLQTFFDYRTPNHPVETAKKIEGSDKWQRWLKAVEPLL